MIESQLGRMQKVTPERFNRAPCCWVSNRVLSPTAVSCIAHNWMTDVREMNSNLMCAAGFDLHIQQCEFLIARCDFIQRMSGAACVTLEHCHASAIVRAASETRFNLASIFCYASINQRRVLLEHLAVAKLIGEFFVSRIVLRHNKQARCVLVYAMHDARPNAASYTGQRIEVIDERVGKRPRIDSRAGMNNHACRFVDDDEIVIFKDYVERDRLGDQLDGRRFGQINFNVIANAQSIARLRDMLIDQHIAVFDCALDSSPAYFRKMRRDEGVEPRAGGSNVHFQDLKVSAHRLVRAALRGRPSLIVV